MSPKKRHSFFLIEILITLGLVGATVSFLLFAQRFDAKSFARKKHTYEKNIAHDLAIAYLIEKMHDPQNGWAHMELLERKVASIPHEKHGFQALYSFKETKVSDDKHTKLIEVTLFLTHPHFPPQKTKKPPRYLFCLKEEK